MKQCSATSKITIVRTFEITETFNVYRYNFDATSSSMSKFTKRKGFLRPQHGACEMKGLWLGAWCHVECFFSLVALTVGYRSESFVLASRSL